MLPTWPPSRSLLSLIPRQGPIRLDQLYTQATTELAPETFRSKMHYKQCLGQLRRTNKVWTYRETKIGKGALARDILAVKAQPDEERWSERRTGRTLVKLEAEQLQAAPALE